MRKDYLKKLLSENPEIQQEIAETTKAIESKRMGIESIRDLMESPELKDLLEDMLEKSGLSDPHRKYLKALFVDKLPQKKAAQKAFGRDLGYQEEVEVKALKDNEVVQDFLDIIKQLYIKFTPIASMREFQMILDPKTEDRERLNAIKDVKATAGLVTEGVKGNELPVNITINMPNNQQNVEQQIINPEGGVD